MNAIPSPVFGDGLVFLMSGFAGNDLKAIRVAEAKGNIDGTSAIAWTLDRDTPYVPSPVLLDGVLYFLKSNSGIVTAVDAKTGTPHYANPRLPRDARRRALLPQVHLGHCDGCRCEDRHPALRESAARGRAKRVCLARGCERAHLLPRPRRHHDRRPLRTEVRSSRQEHPRRWVRRIARAGGQRDVPARVQVPLRNSAWVVVSGFRRTASRGPLR